MSFALRYLVEFVLLLVWVIKAIALMLWAFAMWLTGKHLKDGPRDAKPVIREITGLFTLILSYVVALVFTEQKPEVPRGYSLLLYGVASFVTLWGMVIILRATTNTPDEVNPKGPLPDRHAYDKGSIMFAKVMLGASVLIAGGFALLAGTDRLSRTQTFEVEAKAEIARPKEYRTKTEKLGILVPAAIDPKMFRGEIPQQLNMVISLSGGLEKTWYVNDVEGDIGVPGDSKEMDPPPSFVENAREYKTHPGMSIWLLEGLHATQRYQLRIILFPKDPKKSPSDFKPLFNDIEKGAVAVSFFSKKK